ncbi:RUN and FYVE domain-containing protein 2-like protein [Leptotrombidium deliense]|uniref:RUN and FYVE domain-containing protein 2-like protein n=1 Tax=Leptotrombidium deliense TaxID=299467 RepID=A0A443S9Z9_9ACAR|nr:RUN and FYVE domain-containing protein 2-like protein [Leptotrombidium deliense]
MFVRYVNNGETVAYISFCMLAKKGLLTSKKDLWSLLESVDSYKQESIELTASVKELPNAKTAIGKFRAWIRLAFMQKRLPDYFRFLIDNKEQLLREYYEEEALLLRDEATVISGLLDEDLDTQSNLIDLSNYLRDNSNIETVLDQKNYVEELNRHLSATISDLQKKIECYESDKRSREFLKHNEVVDYLNPVVNLKKDINCTNKDIDTNCALDTVEAQLVDEIKKRKQLESDFSLQVRLKNEMESAVKLLEKDVHEKQETIISLKRQLDDIKAINIQMCNKLQECENVLKTKIELLSQLEVQNSSLNSNFHQMETRLLMAEKCRCTVEEENQRLHQDLTLKEQHRSTMEKDWRKEKEWRVSLQSIVDEQQEQITALQTELEEAKYKRTDFDNLKKEFFETQKKCCEYELSLEEIGVHLKEAKLEADNLKERSGMLKEAVWTKDKDATQCAQCLKVFSVSRRKVSEQSNLQ